MYIESFCAGIVFTLFLSAAIALVLMPIIEPHTPPGPDDPPPAAHKPGDV